MLEAIKNTLIRNKWVFVAYIFVFAVTNSYPDLLKEYNPRLVSEAFAIVWPAIIAGAILNAKIFLDFADELNSKGIRIFTYIMLAMTVALGLFYAGITAGQLSELLMINIINIIVGALAIPLWLVILYGARAFALKFKK